MLLAPRQRVATSRQHWVLKELALVLPPTLTVLGALLATETLTHHRLLFASLASSAFLLYRDPHHPMNSLRVMLLAQTIGCVVGVAGALIFGPGYRAAATAIVVTIALLIAFHIVHPPGISTTLGFAFTDPGAQPVATFLVALALVAALAVLQRVTIWTFERFG